MKKLAMIALAAIAAAMTGCRSIEIENRGEGNGWTVSCWSHWMNSEADGLEASVAPDGTITFSLNGLKSAPSEELNKLVQTSFEGGVKLAGAIGEAYVKIAGGGAQADTALSVAQKVYAYFAGKGGDASKATVTADEAAKTLKVDDGTTCVECDAAGNCSDCTASR